MSDASFILDAVDQVKYKFQSCAGTYLPTPAGRTAINEILDETVVKALKQYGQKIWTTAGQNHVEHVACRVARRARYYARKRGAKTLGAPDVKRAAREVIPAARETLDRMMRMAKSKKEKSSITPLRVFC